MAPPILITQRLLESTWHGLKLRSGGRRESACVWVGHRTQTGCHVREVIFLDDLPGVTAGRLRHNTPKEATRALFSLLHSRRLDILADLHTHPLDWVDLSPVDQRHPLEFRVGLIAIVVPHYAAGEATLATAGVHEYVGSFAWRRLSQTEVKSRILINGDDK